MKRRGELFCDEWHLAQCHSGGHGKAAQEAEFMFAPKKHRK